MNTNLVRLKDIALALGYLKDQVVFVGGATVGLYIDDKAAPEPQPSEDIDCVVEIATYGEWCDFEKILRQKGFLDTDLKGYGNPWFKEGLENSVAVTIEELSVKIFKLEHFVAAKLKAFNDRGATGDIRFSQDLEDLTELIDGCTKFEQTILKSEVKVKTFIVNEFSKFLIGSKYREAMYGFVVKTL